MVRPLKRLSWAGRQADRGLQGSRKPRVTLRGPGTLTVVGAAWALGTACLARAARPVSARLAQRQPWRGAPIRARPAPSARTGARPRCEASHPRPCAPSRRGSGYEAAALERTRGGLEPWSGGQAMACRTARSTRAAGPRGPRWDAGPQATRKPLANRPSGSAAAGPPRSAGWRCAWRAAVAAPGHRRRPTPPGWAMGDVVPGRWVPRSARLQDRRRRQAPAMPPGARRCPACVGRTGRRPSPWPSHGLRAGPGLRYPPQGPA